MIPSEQVRQIIRNSPLSAYRLAVLAGIRPSMLTLFLSGKRSITLGTLDAIAPHLGLTIKGNGRDRRLAVSARKPGRPARENSSRRRSNRSGTP